MRGCERARSHRLTNVVKVPAFLIRDHPYAVELRVFPITRSRAITRSPDRVRSPHGCPTTTIDAGPPPVGDVEIKAGVVFAAVMFAFNTDTVLDPLLAT